MAWRLHYGVLLTADARSESILSPHTKACVIMQCISASSDIHFLLRNAI